MEKHLMEKFKEILEKEEEIKDVKLYYDLEGNWVVSYIYDDQKYVLNVMEIDF